ncbi:unnamed protein product [Bodo saltans]|uniref:Membrane-associated protein n=1 Tax=Bodo saltans TaxID=75058 RepID=A0A0S4J515_BODSA|nr:unnamed protein product [Bodo saltans]|eukprot:CUG86500.1 unnamed protein product [Bodo saltans]
MHAYESQRPEIHWLVIAIVWCCCCCSMVSSLHAAPEAFTTTLVQDVRGVTSLFVDTERNVLYFGSSYLGRVVLGVDCGAAPLVAQVVAGVKGRAGSQDGVGSAALFGTNSMDGTNDGKTLYIADYENSVIRKVSISIAGGGDGAVFNVTTIAGSTPGLQDGVGRAAQLRPAGLALNPAESALYIGDIGNSAIRRINLSTLLVESLVRNSTSTPIAGPTFLRLTPDGEFVIFADSSNHRIARVSSRMESATSITTIAGAVGEVGVLDGVDGSSAQFSTPRGLALSPDRSVLFIGGNGGNVIQAIRLDGTNATITIAGNGTAGNAEACGSGRDYMLDPVAMFSGMQGITLWEKPPQHALSNAPAWALIVGDWTNNVIRCVGGPGVSTPFPPPSFEALATTADTVRGVLAAGSSHDAYIHPITGSLYSTESVTVVVRYDLDNRTRAFIEPPVVVAGSTAGYADGTDALALFSTIGGFAGDGGHIVYITETDVNFCVCSINITSLEVGTVAGNLVNA